MPTLCPNNLENQTEKNMENEMDTAIYRGIYSKDSMR